MGAAIQVHRALGPGLLESTYEICLCQELLLRDHLVSRQVPVPITYRGVTLDCAYRIDVLVDDTLIVEVKSVVEVAPIHQAQLMSYMRLSGKRIGLLINFNVRCLKNGVVRRVL